MIKHIIFDFGGVFFDLYDSNGKHTGVPSHLVEIFGISIEDANKIWNENKEDLLTGKETPKEFLTRLNEGLKTSIDIDKSHETWEKLHSMKKDRINWELVDFVEVLSRKYQIHMLTDVINIGNGGEPWFDLVSKHFNNIFKSHEIGHRKPHKETFLYLLEKINAKPEECIFIDDIKANVDAAEDIGIKSILFEGHIKFPLEILKELRGETSAEDFLGWLCQGNKFILHGSIHEVKGDKIISEKGKIFASNKSAIAIMRSLYSNSGVNLQYPYFIDENHPLKLEIHTKNGEYIKKSRGFVYVLKPDGFKNNPKGSWQFVKESNESQFIAVFETEEKDFTYPVEVFNDFQKND